MNRRVAVPSGRAPVRRHRAREAAAGQGRMTPTTGPAITPYGETTGERRSRLVLAAVMVTAGVLHFVAPDAYARIVPRRLGDAHVVVYLSGAAEAAVGVLLAGYRTRRIGAWCTVAVLLAVFPANVQMALDGGLPGAPGALGSSLVAWMRLPLQVPLVAWALRHARRS